MYISITNSNRKARCR